MFYPYASFLPAIRKTVTGILSSSMLQIIRKSSTRCRRNPDRAELLPALCRNDFILADFKTAFHTS